MERNDRRKKERKEKKDGKRHPKGETREALQSEVEALFGKSKQPEKAASCKTLAEALRASTHQVSNDGTLRYFAKALRIPVHEMPNWHEQSSKGHPVTHLARAEALRRSYLDACHSHRAATGQEAMHLHCFGWYGRDERVSLPRSDPGVGLTVHAHGPHDFGGDLSRAPRSNVVAHECHFATIVDIYQAGDKPTCPMTPQQTAQVLCYTTGRFGYYIRHDLREMFGAHEFEAQDFSDPEHPRVISTVEASWEKVMTPEGLMVSFKPDSLSVPYPLHPDLQGGAEDWMCTASHTVEVQMSEGAEPVRAYLQTHLMGMSGPYQIWKIGLSEERPIGLMDTVFPGPRFVAASESWYYALRALLPEPSSWFPLSASVVFKTSKHIAEADVSSGFIRYGRGAGMAPYSVDIRDAVVAALAFRALNGRVMQDLWTVAQAHFDKLYRPLGERYPGLRLAIALNSLSAGLVAVRAELPLIERLSTQDVNPQTLTDLQKGPGPAAKISWTTIGKGVLVGAIIGWSLYRWWNTERMSSATASVSAPAVEPPREFLELEKASHDLVVGLDAAVSSLKCDLGNKETYLWSLAKYVYNGFKGNLPSKLHNFFFTGEALRGEALEETVKLISTSFGSWIASIGLVTIETLPWLVGGLVKGGLTGLWNGFLLRLPANLFHLSTTVAYLKCGWRAWIPCVAAHFVFNIVVMHATASGVMPGIEYFDTALVDWELLSRAMENWAAGGESTNRVESDKAVTEMPCKIRAVQACPTEDILETPDWRRQSVCATVDGVPIRLDTLARLALHDICCCQVKLAPRLDGVGVCKSCARLPPSAFSWPLVWTNGGLYQPMKNGAGTLACLVLRCFTNKMGFYDSPATERLWRVELTQRLRPVREIVAQMLVLDDEVPTTIAECAAKLGGFKGRNFLSADLDVLQHGQLGKTKLQVKYNEMIKPKSCVYGEVVVKPRCVMNVSTQDQVSILPIANDMTRMLKKAFDGSRVFELGEGDHCVQVRFIIAHATRDNMKRYAEYMSSDGAITVLVSCDDTAVSAGRYSAMLGFAAQETDYESYDQSQHYGFWKTDEMLLNQYGDAFWAFHEMVNVMPVSGTVNDYTDGVKKVVKIKALLRCMMRTGVGTTSILGSLHNILAHVYWLMNLHRFPLFEQASRELGLQVKIERRQRVTGLTFLRGWFDEADGGTWSVLPSMCLKLGKIMKDPQSFKATAGQVFAAIMASVDCSDDTPILGAFKRLASRQTTRGDLERIMHDPHIVENAMHKVRSVSCTRASYLRLMLDRYGVTEHEVLEAEDLILSVVTIPSMVVHPLFDVLRARDYT